MSTPPPGIRISSRVTVVWRPRPSLTRTSRVGLPLLAEERVDERGLPGARRPDQDRGAMTRDVREQRLDALTGERVRHEHVRAERDRLDCRARCIQVGGEVGLREHDDWDGARVPRQREFALDATKVGRLRDRVHDEHRVDVGGQDLQVRGLSGVAARDGARALKHGFDQRRRRGRSGASTATQSPTAGRSAGPLADFRRRADIFARTTPVRRRDQRAAAVAADDARGSQTWPA